MNFLLNEKKILITLAGVIRLKGLMFYHVEKDRLYFLNLLGRLFWKLYRGIC